MKWSKDDRPPDRHRRLKEGWQFDRSEETGRDFICTTNSTDKSPFKSDEEAYNFVAKRAAEGSEYHAVCLAYAVAERLRGL